MVPFLVTLLVLSLTTNLFPIFNVVAILSLIPLRLVWSKTATPDRRLGPTTAVHFLLAAYAFWLFSYLLTTAPLSNLVSYDFLRFSGAILIGYLPLLFLGDVGLSSGFVYGLIWVYLGILSAAAIVGELLLLLLNGGHNPFLGMGTPKTFVSFETDHSMPVMLLGLYRTHMTTGIQYALASLMALRFMLRAKKPKLLSWASLVFVSLLAGMILSGARTAYIAFAAALLLQFVGKKRYSRLLVKIGALVFVPTLLFVLSQPAILARAVSIVNFEGDANVSGRFSLYQEAVRGFSNSPLIGIGFGRFSDSGKTYFGLRHLVYIATGGEVVGEVEKLNEAHDSYLQFLAEGGVLGLFLMLGVWVTTYCWAGRLRHRLQNGSTAAALCDVVQASVVVTLFSSLTGTTMMMATTPLFVFTMVGLLRNVVAFESRARTATSISPLSRVGFPAPTPLARPIPS